MIKTEIICKKRGQIMWFINLRSLTFAKNNIEKHRKRTRSFQKLYRTFQTVATSMIMMSLSSRMAFIILKMFN